MIRLRLFSSADPSRQIDQRMVGEDAVTIGRDPGADWVINDPERALSRRHCKVRATGSGLAVSDLSANGTFVGESDQRLTPGTETMVPPGSVLRLGTFSFSVEALAAEPPAPPQPAGPSPATPSLFAPPRGLEPVQPPSSPARPDPFASQLLPDPLLVDHQPTDRVQLSDGDAWERRPAARAGDWNLPRERPDHENLIGLPREWAEPARPERDAGFGFDAPFERPVLAPAPAVPADVAIPLDWAAPAKVPVPEPVTQASPPAPPVEPVAPPPPAAAAAAATPVPAAASAAGDDLFEAFCTGARLSPAAFAGEDRAAVMLRLGEVYRAMVLGLADVMGERTALKNEYRMTRTMVRPEGNNPFKWAPPQRLAIEVLRSGDTGFAGGTEAVTEGFRDVKVHIICMLAGMRAAVAATMTALSPATIEGQVGGRNFLLKTQRDAALWVEYSDRFEDFKLDAEDSSDGPVNRAFRTAYEQQLSELVGAATGYAGGRR